MKKLMMAVFLILAFVAFGDRTANRAWVENSLKSLSESVEKQSAADRAWVETSLEGKAEKFIVSTNDTQVVTNKVMYTDSIAPLRAMITQQSATDRAWVEESLSELSESIKTNSNSQAFDYTWVEDNFPRVKKGYNQLMKLDDAIVFTNKVVYDSRDDLVIEGDRLKTEYYVLSQDGLRFTGFDFGFDAWEEALFTGNNRIYLPHRNGTIALDEDVQLCVRGIKKEGYPEYICLTNSIGIYRKNGSGWDPLAIYGTDIIDHPYFSVGDDFIRLGVSGLEIATATGEISTDGTRHFMELPKGRDGVIALIEDVDLKLARPSLALGADAEVTGLRAFQLGSGKNTNDDTLQFRDYQIIDAQGKMPSERLKPSTVIDLVKGLSSTELAELKTLLGVQ